MESKKTNKKETELVEDKSESKYANKSGVVVGTFNEAPEFLRDNNYIKKGYRINCNSLKKAAQSFFILHNESVNVWSHFIGAVTGLVLIAYTAIFITSYKTQIMGIVDINRHYEVISNEIKDFTQTILNTLPDFDEARKNYIDSFVLHLTNTTSNLFDLTKNKIQSGCTEYIDTITSSIKKMKNSFENNSTSSILQFLDSISYKWNDITSELYNIIEMHQLSLEPEEVNHPKVKRWPLFIMLSSAIICLGFSASFHLLCSISKSVHKVFSSLDYAGISLLIAGSCYPPYYYFFHCEVFLMMAYLSFISVFALGVFFFSLTPGFHLPKNRTLRGSLFLSLGISAGLPIIHLILFSSSISGFTSSPRLIFWYLGGAAYVIGALMYINRLPEKYFPGKFDFFGSSHQIFHFLILCGVIMHYVGCLDAYYFRVNNTCPVS